MLVTYEWIPINDLKYNSISDKLYISIIKIKDKNYNNEIPIEEARNLLFYNLKPYIEKLENTIEFNNKNCGYLTSIKEYNKILNQNINTFYNLIEQFPFNWELFILLDN